MLQTHLAMLPEVAIRPSSYRRTRGIQRKAMRLAEGMELLCKKDQCDKNCDTTEYLYCNYFFKVYKYNYYYIG